MTLHPWTLIFWAGVIALFFLFGGAAFAEQPPSGSYQASCRNIHLIHGELIALCKRRDGRWEKARLEHADSCQVAEYVDGTLRCMKTRSEGAANRNNFGACYERCLKAYDCQLGAGRAPNDISCSHVFNPECRRTCTSNTRAFTVP